MRNPHPMTLFLASFTFFGLAAHAVSQIAGAFS